MVNAIGFFYEYESEIYREIKIRDERNKEITQV